MFNAVKLWNWQTDTKTPVLTLKAPENIIRNPIYSPDGKRLVAVVATPPRVWTWETTTGEGNFRPLPDSWMPCQAVFTPGGGLAVVSGDRIQFIQPDGSDMRASQPGYRRLLGKVFHILASAWVAGPVQDTQCGFKGFSRDAAHDLFARQRITSIVFDVEVIYLARRRGYRMAVVPVRWFDKRGSRMRASLGLTMRVAWDLFRIPLMHRRAATMRSRVRT